MLSLLGAADLGWGCFWLPPPLVLRAAHTPAFLGMRSPVAPRLPFLRAVPSRSPLQPGCTECTSRDTRVLGRWPGTAGRVQVPGPPARWMAQSSQGPCCLSALAFKCTLCQNAKKELRKQSRSRPQGCAPSSCCSLAGLLAKPRALCPWFPSLLHPCPGAPARDLLLCSGHYFLSQGLGSWPLGGGVSLSTRRPPGLPLLSALGRCGCPEAPPVILLPVTPPSAASWF